MSEDEDAIVIVDPRTGADLRFDSNSSGSDLWQLTRPTSEFYHHLTEQQRAKAQDLYEDYLRRHISINVDGGEPYADREVDMRKEDLDFLKQLASEPKVWCISNEDQDKLNWTIRKREKELKDMDRDGTAYSRAALNRLEKVEPQDENERRIIGELKEYYRLQIEDIKAGRDPLWREIEAMQRQDTVTPLNSINVIDRYGEAWNVTKTSDYIEASLLRTYAEQGDPVLTSREKRLLDSWLPEMQRDYLTKMENEDYRIGRDVVRLEGGNFEMTAVKENGLRTLIGMQAGVNSGEYAMIGTHKEKLADWIRDLNRQQMEFADDPNKVTIEGIHYTEKSSKLELQTIHDYYKYNMPEHRQPPQQDLQKINRWRGMDKPDRIEKEHLPEEDEPIRFHLLTARGLDPEHTELTKDLPVADLKRVKTDYEKGESYCTYNMRYDDYKKLSAWIEEKELKEPKPKSFWDKRESTPLTNSEILSRQGGFEKACRAFEEGDKVIVFAEGKRGYAYFTETLTKNSDLDRLKEAFERTNPDLYEGGFPAAALPENKAKMLAEWITEKEKDRPELKRVKDLTPESDYLKLAAYLAKDDPKRTPEEYWTVHKWAEKQQETFLHDQEKADQKAGRRDVVRGVIFDHVEEISRKQSLDDLRFANDMLDMSDNHRERLNEWIREKQRELAPEETKTPSHFLQDMNAPVKFEKPSNFDWKNAGKPKEYDYVTKDTELSQLKQVAADYEKGESYCTYNLRYDDYYRLNGWIKEKEPEKPTTLKFREADKEQQIQLVCREFDEPEKIVVFPNGQRGSTLFTQVLTKDSSLDQLKEASRTTSQWYHGYNQAAALPPEKQELLKDWIKQRERVADINPPEPAKQPNFEELRKQINKTDWTYAMSDDPSVWRRGEKETEQTREAIRDAAKANPQAMDKYLENLEREKILLTETIDQIKSATKMEKQQTRPALGLPFEPKKQPDIIPWSGREYSTDTPLRELEAFDKALREGPYEERLPADQYKKLRTWIDNKQNLEQRADRFAAHAVTPWGVPDQTTKIASGIYEYQTPAHGGIWLSPEQNARVPSELKDKTFNRQGHRGWYEEDVDVQIVRDIFPEIFSRERAARLEERPKLKPITDKDVEEKKDKETKGITVKNPDGTYEKLTPESRVEDLIMLRKRVRSGERKIRKEELQVLDSWIEDKKKKAPALADKTKQLDQQRTKTESLVREISAGMERTSKTLADIESKLKHLQSTPAPSPPTPASGKISMTVEWADGKSNSFTASSRAEASTMLMSTIDSRSDYSVSSAQRSALSNWASTGGNKPSTMSFESTPTKNITPPKPPTPEPPIPKRKKDKGR